MNRKSWILDCLYHYLPSTFAAVESTDGLGIHILVKYADDDGELVEEEAATTAKIMTWNSRYQVEQPIEQCFFDSFTVAKDKTEGQYMSVAAIYKELKSKYGATLVGNSLISFGRKLKNIDGITHRHTSNSTEYLIVRRYWYQNPGMTETDRYSLNISFCQLLYFVDILQVIKTEWQNDRFFSKKRFFVNLGGKKTCLFMA